VAARRLARYAPQTHQANVLEPWGLPPGSFDSVGMCNVLHCVPGTMSEKTIAFEYANEALAPGGVFFGATILGQGVKHWWYSRAALSFGNRSGVMSTHKDSLEDLDAGLARVFDSHEVRIRGTVALFVAHTSA
jgi:hypothetical protein